MQTNEGGTPANAPGHPVRYVVLTILTVAAICLAGLALQRREARQGDSQAAFGLTTQSCSLSGRLMPLPDISDASGIALSARTPGLLWTHEDSRPVLFALDVLGHVKGRVTVTQATITDWEDLATGQCGGKPCLYLGDIGDNRVRRDRVTVYRVPEPLPEDEATAAAEAFHATYPDGPQDAEALFVSQAGVPHIVTKGNNGPIALYRFPEPLRAGETVTLERVATLLATEAVRGDRVTGAGTSQDGKWVVLRTRDAVLFYDADPLLRGKPSKPVRYEIAGLQNAQAEGVAIGQEGALYLIAEGRSAGQAGLLAHGVCKPPPAF